MTLDMSAHIRQSNLIENVLGPEAIAQSMEAWRYLEKCETLSLEAILEAHRLVMRSLWPQIAGKLRHGGVRVGNESVGWRDCPSPNDVPRLLETWILAMTHPLELDPISMHVEFEHIHPFRDGNGRVGRLLLWWHEVKRGDQPTKILFREVEKYYSLFRGPLDDD